MSVRSLLPSAQFSLIALSIALSGGLVFAADYVSKKPAEGARLAASQQQLPPTDWQATLEQIQANNPGVPPPPPEEAYQSLFEAAQSTNLTESVSRTLLVNLSNVSAQGLGSDIPTQEQLIAAAFSQIEQSTAVSLYNAADLVVVADSSENLRAYGNAFMQVFLNNPQASAEATLFAVGQAAEYDNTTYFSQLTPIEAAYRATLAQLLATPVPKTLSPLHLSAVNVLARIANTYPDLRSMPTDPLRGITGLYQFQTLTDELGRLFTTIAQQLQQNAILFSEDEPGNAWSAFLSV